MADVYLAFLGCRLNESEVEELAWQFSVNGHRVVQEPEDAELYVVNTCTVTGEAGRKSRQLLRRLARVNPDACIAVTGCHATIDPEDVRRLPNVKWVIPNAGKEQLVELVAPKTGREATGLVPPDVELTHVFPGTTSVSYRLGPGSLGRTRAFVKAQDGCDNRCTFCVTTLARGAGRSRPANAIVDEVRGLTGSGYQEVVLSGVHLGSYGRDLGQRRGLYALIEALLAETDVPRLRLSSLEPWDLSPGFFDLWGDPRVCRHLHLPLQSGCDATLRRMARRTTGSGYAQLVAAARARIPDLAVTTDMIVGFPGETLEEFSESYRFVEALEFARLHVFPFSPRPGTAATQMKDQVPLDEKAERCRLLRQLGARQTRAFCESHVGRTMAVLWENSKNGGPRQGLTDNYLRVFIDTEKDLANQILQTQLVKVVGQSLRGELA